MSRLLRQNLFSLLLGAAAAAPLHAADMPVDPEYETYQEGLEAARNGDYDTALEEFRKAADKGLHLAQYNLGVLYYSGRGVPQDFSKAMEWTRKAAEQGHAEAQFNLGAMYYNALGVDNPGPDFWPFTLWHQDENHERAAQWYERAAENGHTQARYNLATMYENGEGVERDMVQAHFWAQAALRNDMREAVDLIDRLEQDMSRAQMSEAQNRFAEWVLER